MGQFGVTEGEFTCMFIHIFTGVFGQNMWNYKLNELLPFANNLSSLHPTIDQILGIKLGTSFVYFYAGMLLSVSLILAIRTIFTSENRSKSISEFLGFFLLVAMELSWSKMKIYGAYNGVILVNFGIVASLLVCKMIICSVTKVPY